MRYYITCIILYLTTIFSSFGQAYKYISMTEGLSDRRVLEIQKDSTGFMWFLTYAGINRYDGKHIKHYLPASDDGYVSFYTDKNILKTDPQGNIWFIADNGEVFRHVPLEEKFEQVALPAELVSPSLKLVKMTDLGLVWYTTNDFSYTYDPNTEELRRIELGHKHEHVTSVFQANDTTFYLGSDDGICQSIIKKGEVIATQCLIPHEQCKLPRIIYVHPATNLLFAGSESDGLIIYDLTQGEMKRQYSYLKDFPINGFHPYGEGQLLIPTQGAGVYSYDLQTEDLQPMFHANVNEPNKMNGNNIRSLYIDEDERIWMAVQARGITIYDKHLPAYKWYKNHLGNNASLNDDLVNAILEDSDGDIWFATNNGLSLYNPSKDTWKHLFAWDNVTLESMKNSIFLSLCETKPGTIIAGGFMTGVYAINKRSMSITQLTPLSYKQADTPIGANKYIRVIYRDTEGATWTGGSNYLGYIDKKNTTFKHYPIEHAITCIEEQDSATLLIGTGNGMYSLNKETEEISQMRMPFASQQINAIYLHPNGDLYVGTTNSGLVILRTNGEYEQYLYQTSALLSNTINTIVPKSETEIILATEQNIVLFNDLTKKFTNWTDDQGLIKTNFNPRAGIRTSRNTFIFGSNIGAVEWSDTMKLPRQEEVSPIIFDQVMIEEQHDTPAADIQAIVHRMDSINELPLQPNQRNLALHIATINYYSPHYTYFQWRLKGKYDYWQRLGKDNWLRFRDLPPGEYTLNIQNISAEDYRVVSQRDVKIIVIPAFWETRWALFLYLVCIVALFTAVLRYIWMRRQQKSLSEKARFLVNTVNSIRTPLTLVKSAMSEVMNQREISTMSNNYLLTACYSVDKLGVMATNLLNIDKILKGKKVHVRHYDANQLIRKFVKPFTSLTTHDNISIQFVSPEEELPTWIDATKIELIFYNLMSNLIRQTTPGKIIYISLYSDSEQWGFNICNSQELMEPSFATSAIGKDLHMDKNKINAELHLIDQLVRSHQGKMHYMAMPPSSYLFSITFPIKDSHYTKKHPSDTSEDGLTGLLHPLAAYPDLTEVREVSSGKKYGHILIVNESSDALQLLNNALRKEWDIATARTIPTALNLIEEHEPDIIITSSGIPLWGGYDLGSIVKSNVNTSHIPIILMASNDDRETIQRSFRQRADHYVTSPNDLFVIQSILDNLLENRHQLHDRLSKADQVHHLKEIKQANVEQEAKFLTEVKEIIHAHVDNPEFNVDELCSIMGMSRTNLYNKIKALTNQPLNVLIRDARMKRAGEMLVSEEHNISEVCDILGFSELKYFREVFKKFYGMSPSEYIKQNKEEESSKTETP